MSLLKHQNIARKTKQKEKKEKEEKEKEGL